MPVQIDAKASMPVDGRPATFSLRTLLGKRDDDVAALYARQLIERISKTTARSLLLGIALKDRTPATLRAVLELIDARKVW